MSSFADEIWTALRRKSIFQSWVLSPRHSSCDVPALVGWSAGEAEKRCSSPAEKRQISGVEKRYSDIVKKWFTGDLEGRFACTFESTLSDVMAKHSGSLEMETIPYSSCAVPESSAGHPAVEAEKAPSQESGDSMTTIPKSQRRGLLSKLTLLAEVGDPKTYARPIKWFITLVVALAGVTAPMGSAIFFPCLHEITNDLHTSPTITNLSVALYMLSLAISPIWWSSFSESFGRRTIYIISLALFVIFAALAALSPTITVLVTMRVLAGGTAGSVQAVGAGTIADIWPPKERGRAMGIFYLGPLMGPLLAPILGGALTSAWGWRSTQWFLASYGFVILVLVVVALPETLSRSVSVTPEQAKSIPISTSQQMTRNLKRVFLEPLRIVLDLRHPLVALNVYYASITFAALYMLQISLQATFTIAPYSFSTTQLGLIYIPVAVGYIFASVLGGRWTDRIMAREACRRQNSNLRPEDRLRENAWLAAVAYPTALVTYAWLVQLGIIWPAPLAATAVFGAGCMLIFGAATTMLTELLPRRAASAVALNNLVRNTGAAAVGTVTQPLLGAVGNGCLFSLVGGWCLISCVVIWAMRRWGGKWRRRMEEEDQGGSMLRR